MSQSLPNNPVSATTPRRGHRSLVAATLAASVLVSLIYWRISVREWQQTMDRWQGRLSSVATQRQQLIESWLNERRSDCQVIAGYPTVATRLSAGGAPGERTEHGRHLTVLLDKMRSTLGYLQLAVHDRDGRMVVQVGESAVPAAEAVASARRAVENGSFRADHPDNADGSWYMIFAQPVRQASADGTSMVIGAVTLQFDARPLFAAILNAQDVSARSGETVLVEHDGGDVRYLLQPRHATETGLRRSLASSQSAASAALAGEERFGEFRDYRGVRVLAATRYIQATGWGLITEVDRSEAFANYWQNFWQVAAAALFAVLGFAAFILAESRRQRNRTLENALTKERELREARNRAEEEVYRLNMDLERRVRERTAQLEQANQELQAFNYSVSHDLRTPLRHISGFAQILLEDHVGELSEDARRHVQTIVSGSQRMAQLIDALLQLSRVGLAEIQERSVNLAAEAHAAFRDLRPTAGDRHIEFIVGDLPEVSGDPVLLRQLLENLLANALKFTRPVAVARIEMGAQASNGTPVFYVRDNGVGFDANFADRLFGVFQRLHKRDEFEGTGIGLSIVKRIVEKHGGRIWAESPPNSGATFHFTLPPAGPTA